MRPCWGLAQKLSSSQIEFVSWAERSQAICISMKYGASTLVRIQFYVSFFIIFPPFFPFFSSFFFDFWYYFGCCQLSHKTTLVIESKVWRLIVRKFPWVYGERDYIIIYYGTFIILRSDTLTYDSVGAYIYQGYFFRFEHKPNYFLIKPVFATNGASFYETHAHAKYPEGKETTTSRILFKLHL